MLIADLAKDGDFYKNAIVLYSIEYVPTGKAKEFTVSRKEVAKIIEKDEIIFLDDDYKFSPSELEMIVNISKNLIVWIESLRHAKI